MTSVYFSIKNDDKELGNPSHSSNQISADANAAISSPPNVVPVVPSAEAILSQFETDQTKLMNNEQLERFVLLQKLHVITLQRKRLEHLNNIDNAKNVAIDYIGFDDGIIDNNANQAFENM